MSDYDEGWRDGFFEGYTTALQVVNKINAAMRPEENDVYGRLDQDSDGKDYER